MDTNHTENFKLNFWESADTFVKEKFTKNTNRFQGAGMCVRKLFVNFLWGDYMQEEIYVL